MLLYSLTECQCNRFPSTTSYFNQSYSSTVFSGGLLFFDFSQWSKIAIVLAIWESRLQKFNCLKARCFWLKFNSLFNFLACHKLIFISLDEWNTDHLHFSPQRTKKKLTWCTIEVRSNFFICFLEKLKIPKRNVSKLTDSLGLGY